MSAAIAMAPSPAPHDRPFATSSNAPSANTSSATPSAAELSAAAAAVAAVSSSPSAQRTASSAGTPHASSIQRIGSRSPHGPAAKSSPPSASRGGPPKIVVKKEPSSPEPTPRHRPRRLDLSKGSAASSGAPGTARPMTARDGLGIQEVGLACLSPGFVTHDPAMKEQLQRSMTVREQQRHIIEARLQQQSAKGDGEIPNKDKDNNFAAKTPGMSRRNRAPPGLSIVAPSHETFASERVIQSAPLGQTFTGIHNHPHPLTRHITNLPSKLSNTSHIHHVPANQTNNRLPPIADVFGQGLSGHPDSSGHSLYVQQSGARGPMTSPGHPPPMSHPPPPTQHHQQPQAQQQQQQQQQQPLPQPPTSARPREYRSAEEAQADLAGGRPELLPKLVHYGGHQPPTPPSPQLGYSSRNQDGSRSSRRRPRTEYEDGGSPPLGSGRPAQRRGPFGEGRDSPETQRAKRDEFLRLCERAWDLFHS